VTAGSVKQYANRRTAEYALVAGAFAFVGGAAMANSAEVSASSAPANAQKIDGAEPRYTSQGYNDTAIEMLDAASYRTIGKEGLTLITNRPPREQEGGDKAREFGIAELKRPDLSDPDGIGDATGYGKRDMSLVLETRRSLKGDDDKFQEKWRESDKPYEANTLTGRFDYKVKLDWGQQCLPGRVLEVREKSDTVWTNLVDDPGKGFNYGEEFPTTNYSETVTIDCPK
jgi:hypothetical protein